jgi:type II protein arginine methyltransferase
MTDWTSDLSSALVSGDPAFMKAMLARVPKDVLQRAVPYLEELARNSAKDGGFEEAVTYYDQLIDVAPDNVEWRTNRAKAYFKLDRLQEALLDARKIAELTPGQALGYRLQAEAHEGLRERAQAVAAYRQALRFELTDSGIQQRIEFLETEIRKAALLQQTLDPAAATQPLQIELPPPPTITFDPVLLDRPSLPEALDQSMIGALTQHLRRYSGHQSSKNTLDRLDDPTWLALWDNALRSTAGFKTLLHGSELGTFAVRALQHGATKVVAVEAHPLDGRISSGIVQKHLLNAWHAEHGQTAQEWTEDERRKSFEQFAGNMEVVPPDSEQLTNAQCECFVFPNIDHSLLGTGLVGAIRRFRQSSLAADARFLPAKARIYAMGIQWIYPGTSLDLRPIDHLRWSPSPQPLELPATCWTALTETVQAGEIDFERFADTVWDVRLPVRRAGDLNAIVYWFELDIGSERLSNAPGGPLTCIKPAVQYTDTMALGVNDDLQLKVKLTETRLHFQTQPPPSMERSHLLPSWYIPMVVDELRNTAFKDALAKALSVSETQTVLDIGAGFGLLSMMAAQNSAARVYGCEVNPAIASIADEIVKLNGFENRIKVINKDCRRMAVPDDLPARADLAVFELFDCSVIGEGILHFLAYAREHLLTENARYLPMAATVRAMIVEYRLDRVWDIDVNILNPYRFSQSFINVDANRLSYRALTQPFDVFSFDFSNATPTPQQKDLSVSATADGVAGAVLFWFDLQLDESRWLSNSPTSGSALHWKQALQFLPEAKITRDLALPIDVKHDGSSTVFRWKPDGLPKETFATLPRFDPRVLQQTSELQMQTRNILQHCMSNPGEYAKVAELAKRVAIDPAAHELDPKIAQRFAATFFGS